MRRISLLLAAALLVTPALGEAQDKPAGPTFEPYGFALLHAFFADGIFVNKDNAYQVQAGGAGANDSTGFYQFSVRGSRLGFRVGNLNTGYLGATGSLVLEYDVQGGYFVGQTGTITNTTRSWLSPGMRLRLANGKLDWKTDYGSWQLLFGQDFGLLGPVFANSVTYGTDPVFVRAGKIYIRSPQARLTYSNTFDMVTVNLAAAALAAIEADAATIEYGPGNKSRMPSLEGRAMVTVKPDKDFFGTVNAAYHMHTRRYPTATTKRDLDASIVSFGLDATLTQYAQLKGEYYINDGADDTYLGILAGNAKPTATSADPATYKNLKSTGYWAQLTLKPIPELWIAGGYGVEEADSASKAALRTTTSATATNIWWGNTQTHVALISNASKNLAIGLEYIMVESKYVTATPAGDSKAKANQLSLSTRFSF